MFRVENLMLHDVEYTTRREREVEKQANVWIQAEIL